jgi:hypothetical protein
MRSFNVSVCIRNILLTSSIFLKPAGLANANADQFKVYDSLGSYVGIFYYDNVRDRTLFRDPRGTPVGFSVQNRTYDFDGSFLGYIQRGINKTILNSSAEVVGFVGGRNECYLYDSQENLRGWVRLSGGLPQDCSTDNANKAAAFLLFLDK